MSSGKQKNDQKILEEALMSVETDYDQLSEAQEKNIVLDFIYHDARRVASFLSQFQVHGAQQSIKATEGVGRSETTKGNLSATLRVPIVASGQASTDYSATSEERDAAEYTFDPIWANARKLLSFLDEEELIFRNPGEAMIGQFVQVSGALLVYDPTLLKDAWKLPLLEDLIRRNNPEMAGKEEEMTLFLSFVPVLPHLINCVIVGDEMSFWATLSDASMIATPGEIALKYGSVIPGRWTMVGIMDAFPDNPPEPVDGQEAPMSPDAIAAELSGTAVGRMSAQFAAVAREMMGRPRGLFGMTPLVIFREISGADPTPDTQ